MNRATSHFNLYDYYLGDDRMSAHGSRSAIEFKDHRFTYLDLKGEVDYWVQELASRGVKYGDRVALLLYDSPEFVAGFLASAALGAIAVPINTFLSAEDVQFIISDSDASLVVAESELEDKLGSLERERRRILIPPESRPCVDADRAIGDPSPLADTTPDTSAFMLYTSGSTGRPKGVLHKHGAMAYTIESYARTVLRLTESDRVYSASRLFFAYGLGNSLSFPLSAGATVILDTVRPTPDYLARLLSEQKPTVFFGVPAVYMALLQMNAHGSAVDTSSLRLCISAGEALPATIFEEWKRSFGMAILDGIGSTEMLHIFISNRPVDARPGSSGRVVEGYAVKLADDNGNELQGQNTGNLWIRGDSALECYWNLPDATEETIKDGWVRTGDVYFRDGEDYFYHVGRSDDCFKVSGLWVSPIEVESVLISHESVIDAAVVADTDSTGLATAHAFVVIRKEGASELLKDELRSHARARLPQYKVPSLIDFIDELPRTVTGKVQRFKLRSGYSE